MESSARWRRPVLESQCGYGEIRPDLPIGSLARMLGAAFKEAGIMIATADDPAQARALASKSAGQLIAGLRLDQSNALHE
jgi:hypothetical protein